MFFFYILNVCVVFNSYLLKEYTIIQWSSKPKRGILRTTWKLKGTAGLFLSATLEKLLMQCHHLDINLKPHVPVITLTSLILQTRTQQYWFTVEIVKGVVTIRTGSVQTQTLPPELFFTKPKVTPVICFVFTSLTIISFYWVFFHILIFVLNYTNWLEIEKDKKLIKV